MYVIDEGTHIYDSIIFLSFYFLMEKRCYMFKNIKSDIENLTTISYNL